MDLKWGRCKVSFQINNIISVFVWEKSTKLRSLSPVKYVSSHGIFHQILVTKRNQEFAVWGLEKIKTGPQMCDVQIWSQLGWHLLLEIKRENRSQFFNFFFIGFDIILIFWVSKESIKIVMLHGTEHKCWTMYIYKLLLSEIHNFFLIVRARWRWGRGFKTQQVRV